MTSEIHDPFVLEDQPVEFRGHLLGLREGEIRFPRCEACDRPHWYPMKLCPHCGGQVFGWMSVPGHGTLYSWTRIRRPFSPEFVGRVPYVVGLVEFDEVPGIRLVTNILSPEGEDPRIGMALEPVFSVADDGRPLVGFRSPERVGK